MSALAVNRQYAVFRRDGNIRSQLDLRGGQLASGTASAAR